jgi:Histidine kinase
LTVPQPEPARRPAAEPTPAAGQRLDTLERRLDRTVRVAPYVILAISTVLGVIADGLGRQAPGGWPVTLAVVGLTAGWMLWMVTLHPAWRRRPGPMALYCTGLLVLIAVLVFRSPIFGLFVFTAYLHLWELLRGRWRLAGVAVAAAIHVASIFGGRLPEPTLAEVGAYLLLVAVIAAMVAVFSRWGEITTEQNEQRKRVIAELAEANAKLEAAMAENAELQTRLLAQAREAGTLDERQRMAREIHDTLAQGLTGIVTQVQAARNAADRPADWRRATSTTPSGWPGRAWRRRAGACVRSARSRWTRPASPTPWPTWSTAGRVGTGSGPRSPPPARCARCTRRSRWPCSAPPRRPWPTWQSTPTPPGSA